VIRRANETARVHIASRQRLSGVALGGRRASPARARWKIEVERCVSIGIADRPPLGGCRYRAFVDPSGGSNDSFTLAIAHKEDRLIVLDRVVERKPPFSPVSVVEEFAAILKLYRVNKVEGDRYAGEWPRE
jgi:hypothetical protein